MRLQRFEDLERLVALGQLPRAGLMVTTDREAAERIIGRVAAQIHAERYDVEEPGAADIRELIRSTVVLGRPRLYVIWQAETLQRASQLSLLKTLEEPPGPSWFFLVTADLLGVYDIVRARCWEWATDYVSMRGVPWNILCRSAEDDAAVERLNLADVLALAERVADNLERAALPNVFAITRPLAENQYLWFLKCLAYVWQARMGAADNKALWARGLEYIQHHAYLLQHTQGQPERLVEGVLLKLWWGVRRGFADIPTVPGVW